MGDRLALAQRFVEGDESLSVFDGHFHLISDTIRTDLIANLPEIMRACRVEAIAIASLTSPHGRLAGNMMAALAKVAYPRQVYIFGGLHHYLPAVPEERINLADQAKKLMRIGFDGIKMIEGKPTVRGELGYPLDAPIYDGFYAYLESERIPLIFHVGDPPEFWAGVYKEARAPGREELYQEVDRVLGRFPNLRIIFAHFYFMSDDLERAARFLDQHPTVSFDLTPHPGMYVDFSRNPERAREFFLSYQDRIIFGTDNHGEERDFPPGAPLEYWPVYKVAVMRAFLETGEEFPGWHHTLRGIALGPEVLGKIYRGNLTRYVGNGPKPLDVSLAVEECERILALARRYAIMHRILPGIGRFIQVLRSPELLQGGTD